MKNYDWITHFKATFGVAPIAMLLIDYKGVIIATNNFSSKLFGYTHKVIQGKQTDLLFPSRFSKKIRQCLNRLVKLSMSPHSGKRMIMQAVNKQGATLQVEVALAPYDNDHDFAIMIINPDDSKSLLAGRMTMDKKLESRVEQRTKNLEETLRSLKDLKNNLERAIAFQKALLDNAGAIIIATEENGIIKLFNAEASKTTGYTESEIIDKKTPVLFHDKAEIDRKRLYLSRKSGAAIAGDFDVLVEKARRNIHEEEQYTYIRKDGSSFPVSLTVTAIRGNDDTITGFVGIAIDISERKKSEEKLRAALQKEKELNELKSKFVSLVSHEFRTPLSTVLSSSYLVEQYSLTEDQPKREKHLKRIVSSVEALTDTLNDLLNVGRIEEGKIQAKLTALNLPEFVSDTTEELKVILKKKQLIRYIHTGDTLVLLDISLLKHILQNLISNASKFSPEESFIDIKTIVREDHIILSVKDRGIGILPEDQQHLMERFFRGSNAANIEGTGLGLHIVAKYAGMMHGVVKCISKPDKGTELIITFSTTIKPGYHEEDSSDRRQRSYP